jgi:ubiquinone/menaquinone biosynthesis C-methylase UbiE
MTWSEWKKKQESALDEYHSPDYFTRWDQGRREFGEFCQARGSTLDIGAGISSLPWLYVQGSNIDLVGLDPLDGGHREYPFVRAVGEFMPFRQEVFDVVICASILDHLINPGTVLQEIQPILKPQGNLFVWSGIYRTPFDEAVGYMKKSTGLIIEAVKKRDFRHFKDSAYYAMCCARTLAAISLGRRHQVEDPHHFTHFSNRSIVALIAKSGYGISRIRFYENSVMMCANKKER